MTMKEISLTEILEAREHRVAVQQELLHRFRKPLICFTMNIPGPVKHTPLIARGFADGCRALLHSLEAANIAVLHWDATENVTGCEAFCVADAPAERLKAMAAAIEDGSPVGRLFDMDVLDIDGQKLTRDTVGGKSRDCIVCGKAGLGCASRRVHSIAELQAATNRLLTEHFAKIDEERFAHLAVSALLEEVHTTPKPGLVDRRNTGSHKDMDLAVFEVSAQTLRPYFAQCFRIGRETADLPPASTFCALRAAGLEAEKAMYAATFGVNTHKGVIYSMGILCGALGRLWKPENPAVSIEKLLAECVGLVTESAAADLAKGGDTAGLKLYEKTGLSGIRGEVADGLPSVANIALPAFRQALESGLDRNSAGLRALLQLIAKVEDTNLYHRGGQAGADFAKAQAAALLPHPTQAQLEALDDTFIEKNLSPGGCADLLAITYFLDSL